MTNQPNRIAKFFPIEPPAPDRPPSVADRLFAELDGEEIELYKFEGDDGTECRINFQLTGELPEGDAADVLASLLAQFRTPRGEAGAA